MKSLFTLFGEIAIQNEAANKAIDETTQKAEEASGKMGKSFSKIGGVTKKIGGAAVAAGVVVGTAWMNAVENSRDYRTEMGKLNTAFETNGHTTTAAANTYKQLQAVLGETDTAVEAANHLAVMTDNEKDLKTWTEICTGVFATFGDSLPIEGLTEAANETAKVGQVTGPLADALNWAGIKEDEFNQKLAACTTEQERQNLIMNTLNGTYSQAAEHYRATSGDILAANTAQDKLTFAISEFGRIGEPIMIKIKTAVADMALAAVPHLENFVNWVGSLGDKWNTLKTNVSDSVEKVREFLGLNVPTGTHTSENGVLHGGGAGKGFGAEVQTTVSEESEGNMQKQIDDMDFAGNATIHAAANSEALIQSALNQMDLTVDVTPKLKFGEKLAALFGFNGSHAGGLDRVPFDGYRAILHKDEMVLRASEAAVYRGEKEPTRGSMRRRNTAEEAQPINVTMNFNGRTGSPYEIAAEVKNALEMLRWGM